MESRLPTERDQDRPTVRCRKEDEPSAHLLDVGLQPRLLLVVLQEEGQVLGPAVFEASGQVHVDAVLRERRVEVCVEVPRILCGQEMRSDTAPPPRKGFATT